MGSLAQKTKKLQANELKSLFARIPFHESQQKQHTVYKLYLVSIPEKIQNLITVENLLSANMNFNSILGLLECRLLALRQTVDHPLLSSTVGRSVNPGGVSRN